VKAPLSKWYQRSTNAYTATDHLDIQRAGLYRATSAFPHYAGIIEALAGLFKRAGHDLRWDTFPPD